MSLTQIRYPFFFFNDTSTTEIYTLSLHDALPISQDAVRPARSHAGAPGDGGRQDVPPEAAVPRDGDAEPPRARGRSEEHTSELQSQSNLVCRLLLEKKKNKNRLISMQALFASEST